MKRTVITTVGVSLLFALRSRNISFELSPEEIVTRIYELEKHETICAEISSVRSLLQEGIVQEPANLYLLTSDTDDGRKVSEVIRLYFSSVFKRVYSFSIENLDGGSSDSFKEDGLRNLVKLIVQTVKAVPQQEKECVINATGGYKAQISFAGLIGQVMKIPVYYQFEGFSSVVQLPEMPITFDYKIWLKHFPLFRNLFELGVMSTKLLPEYDLQSLKGLVEQSSNQVRLSSVGLLMHEVLWSRFGEEGALYLPVSGGKEKLNAIEGATHIPLSLQTVLESIASLPFVNRVIVSEEKQGVSGPMTFHVSNHKEGYIEGSYGQENQTWQFQVETTATDEVSVNAACVELHQRFQPLTESKKDSSIEFILVRHGQHVGEHENRIEGWADFELTETGHLQSARVAARLKRDFPKIDVLYASSLSRARETAAHIESQIGLSPILLNDLRAINYGKPGGLTKGEAAVLYPVAYKSTIFNKTYEGESEFDFSRRITELFYELMHNHQGKTVCIVTHGRAINVILREVMKLPASHDFRVDSADTSVHHFVVRDGQTFLKCVNSAEHLVGIELA